MKKIASIIIAFMVTVGLGVPTFAVTNDNSLTVENTGSSSHIFELYQIFTGDVVQGKTILSNVAWGNGIKNPQGSASDQADKLTSTEALNGFIQQINGQLQNPIESTEVKPGDKYTFNNLTSGYYLVKDKEGSQDGKESSAYTSYIVKVVGKVEAQTKLDVPTVNKFVKDINDSQSTSYTDWEKTADHDIGDKIPFELVGTLPTNYGVYSKYKYVFNDVESPGLTFDKDSVKVFVDGQQINNGYEVKVPGTANNTFSVVFDDLKKVTGVNITNKSKISVQYESTLNSNAVIGSKGNPNQAFLEYSNNPNNNGNSGSMGKTPNSKVIVFTYKVIINKVDQNGKPLAGANFMLEKKLANGTYEKVQNVTISQDKTSFEFKGLDDGTYKLTETTTPEGYNSIAPVEFKIVANHDDGTLSLQTLNGEKVSGKVELNFTSSVQNGSLSTDVVNKSGVQLPETGGRGTRLIYILGIVLILASGLYYFADKKVSKNK